MNSSLWCKKVSLQREAAAASLLCFVLFILPTLLKFIFPHLELTGVLMVCSMSGLMVFKLFTPDEIGISRLKWLDVCFAFCTAAVLTAGSALLTFVWGKILAVLDFEIPDRQAMLEYVSNSYGGEFLLLFFALCVMTPLLEELLFRRLFYGMLLRINRCFAFFAVAVVFGICHFFLLGLPGLILLGIGYQWVFLRRQNLAVAALTHALGNAAAVIASMFGV